MTILWPTKSFIDMNLFLMMAPYFSSFSSFPIKIVTSENDSVTAFQDIRQGLLTSKRVYRF